ncbi:MAG: hypothetical protein ACFN4C_00845 [Limosilactobacillus fermentum]
MATVVTRLPVTAWRAATTAPTATRMPRAPSSSRRRSWGRMGLGTVKAKAESLWRP